MYFYEFMFNYRNIKFSFKRKFANERFVRNREG